MEAQLVDCQVQKWSQRSMPASLRRLQTLKMYLLLAVSSLSGGMQNLLLGGTDSLVVLHGFRSMWAQ